MNNYSPEDAQMYLLDFGSEALKAFRNSPSVGDVVFQNDSEKINRLFDLLKKELKKRTQIISDYGGDYNLYITSSNKPMPMLIVVINNYEAFSENYGEKYDDDLLTLTRDGSKCGISFVFTASTYNDVRYRLSQNFRQKLALQVNNPDDYLNIFDGVGKKRPSHLFGRGMVKMEDIYEFQTARICEPKEWNTFISSKINELRSQTKVFAKPIPVLPTRVTIDNVKDYIKDLSSVPIGLDKKTLEVCTYDFSSNLLNIITGKNIDITSELIINLIDVFKLMKNVEVYILDAEKVLQTENGVLELNFNNFTIGMNNNVNMGKKVVCIIIGIDKFIKDVQNENDFGEMLKKAEDLNNYSFILVDSSSKFKNREYDSWYKSYVSNDCAIWVGNGVTDQYLISVNNSNRDIVNNCGQSFGYKIWREKPTQVKLIGMKEERE